MPTAAITTPATAGPTIRDALKSPELSATAFWQLTASDQLERERLPPGRVEHEDHAAERRQGVDERQ